MIRVAQPTFGRNLLTNLSVNTLKRAIVFSAEPPWSMVRKRLESEPMLVEFVGSMELSDLEKLVGSLPDFEFAIGMGGGVSIDSAKFAAWKRRRKLILIPTVLSTDAPFTKSVGVRVNGRVRYIGEIYPELLLIDFDILQSAPKRLNRSGAGDILSIYTALWDWKLAHEAIGESYDESIADESKSILQTLIESADEIRECTEKGLETLAELFLREVSLCEKFGNSRPEEGSEHYLAYCIEYLTRKKFLHGELVTLCVILTSLYQGQDAQNITEMIKRLGVEYSIEKVGITEQELVDSLLYLPEYLNEEKQLLYGVYHSNPPTKAIVKELLEKYRNLCDSVLSL